tara:strand:+ start:1230 stop:2177 length:948 start_codon:yes stop_codon:yes gene_type:complete
MINKVRNTVLSVINKNNYGYISPSDFNLYAKQAQLDIFEGYFSDYNNQINKENARLSGTGYADITKRIEEGIDIFSVTNGLVHSVSNKYELPSQTTTGHDYYLLNKALVYQTLLDEGSTTSFVAGQNQLIDTAADFSIDISVGDIIAIESGGVQYVTVISIDSIDTLTTTGTLWVSAGISYAIYKSTSKLEEAEKVSHSKATILSNSMLTAPSLTYPNYTHQGTLLTVYPNTITALGQIQAQYIRYPKEPKWTYLTLPSGEPLFSASASDYQDFELPLDDENTLVLKILQYAGMSIREGEIYQFGNSEEIENKQQ